MADKRSSDNGKDGAGDVDRYRQAATDALEMVDWCIGYMVGTHKDAIANALARNRKFIREQLLDEAAEPVPTSKD
jgi:hypothetical protein